MELFAGVYCSWLFKIDLLYYFSDFLKDDLRQPLDLIYGIADNIPLPRILVRTGCPPFHGARLDPAARTAQHPDHV